MNIQDEHDMIKAFVSAARPTCRFVWTSGRTDTPAGLTDWYWDLGTTTQLPVVYFAWSTARCEPNNNADGNATVENTILMDSHYDFTWEDVHGNLS